MKGQGSTTASGDRGTIWLRRIGLLAAVLLALHLDLQSWNSAIDWLLDRRDEAFPLRSTGAPVFVVEGDRATVYLLTQRQQMQRPRRWTISQASTRVDLHSDLWAFDAGKMEPQWHRRVFTDADRNTFGEHALLGVDRSTVWIHADGLRAFDAETGESLIDQDAIERQNGVLARQLVSDRRYYGFDSDGLYLIDAAARFWRIDAATFVARPAGTTAAVRPEAVAPAYSASTDTFRTRGMKIGPHWLGLLTDAEAERLSASPVVPGERSGAAALHLTRLHVPDFLDPLRLERYRLWRARIDPVSAAPEDWPADFPDHWGTRDVYSNYTPLPELPELLAAGLLDRGREDAPIWLRDPDSVLVLHRDRLGDDGQLRLARVAGPAGRVVWDAKLPLSALQSVMFAEGQLVLFGRLSLSVEHTRASRYPDHRADELLVTVNLGDGSLRSFNLRIDGGALLDAVDEKASENGR